jgi:hypothetical protein
LNVKPLRGFLGRGNPCTLVRRKDEDAGLRPCSNLF